MVIVIVVRMQKSNSSSNKSNKNNILINNHSNYSDYSNSSNISACQSEDTARAAGSKRLVSLAVVHEAPRLAELSRMSDRQGSRVCAKIWRGSKGTRGLSTTQRSFRIGEQENGKDVVTVLEPLQILKDLLQHPQSREPAARASSRCC